MAIITATFFIFYVMHMIHMNAHECTWMHMNAHECTWYTWMHMNAHECTWMHMIHMNAHECTWMHMNAHECTWMHMIHMNAHECTWYTWYTWMHMNAVFHFLNLLSSSSLFNVMVQDYVLQFPHQWKMNLNLAPSILFTCYLKILQIVHIARYSLNR